MLYYTGTSLNSKFNLTTWKRASLDLAHWDPALFLPGSRYLCHKGKQICKVMSRMFITASNIMYSSSLVEVIWVYEFVSLFLCIFSYNKSINLLLTQLVLLSLTLWLVALCVAFVLELPWKGKIHHYLHEYVLLRHYFFVVKVMLSFSLAGKSTKSYM